MGVAGAKNSTADKPTASARLPRAPRSHTSGAVIAVDLVKTEQQVIDKVNIFKLAMAILISESDDAELQPVLHRRYRELRGRGQLIHAIH